MTFRILWNWPALVSFYNLHPHTAMIVDRAVIRFAEHGEGHLRWVAPYHRLRAGLYDAVLALDIEARTVTLYQMR